MPTLPVPQGCSIREATADDVQAVTALVNEVNVAEVGVPWLGVDEVLDILTLPTRQPGEHLLLLAADGSPIGYLMLVPDADPFTSAQLLSFVRPALWGRGLNAWLLRLGEELARERLHASGGISSIALRVARWTANHAAVPLFESLGYRYVRTFHDLRIDFEGSPPGADTPNGIVIRTVDPDSDGERVYQALREAFAGHWGGTFEPFADWRHQELESSSFDAGLWFLAVDGEDVAGALVARVLEAGATPAVYVGSIGVRRPWRGRGIARALLLSLFREAHRRGYPAVELGVDSENATGATRLYEDVGMRIVRTNEVWQKRLRRSGASAG